MTRVLAHIIKLLNLQFVNDLSIISYFTMNHTPVENNYKYRYIIIIYEYSHINGIICMYDVPIQRVMLFYFESRPV